jgi:hypothetical protein
MGDLLGKATEMIEDAKENYYRLKNSGLLKDFYPLASGEWTADMHWYIDSYINLPANKMEKLNAIENKAMEDSLVDTYVDTYIKTMEDAIWSGQTTASLIKESSGDIEVKKLDHEDIMVTKPPHYTYGSMEVFDMMVAVFGPEKVKAYCEIAAFKYRMRAGRKDDVTRDINKAMWYEDKYKSL